MPEPHTSQVTFDEPVKFEINIAEQEVQKVLAFARLTDVEKLNRGVLQHEPSSIEEYGLPPKKLKALVDRLRNGYDWRKEERKLNEMGQHYKIKLKNMPDEGDLEMHCVLCRSTKPNATPLVLVHGWPSTFAQMLKIVPLLIADFHVIVPSLPGFCFSQAPSKHAVLPWSLEKHAIAVDACMRALFGEDCRYFAQAGDLGMDVVRRMAQLFPQRLRAMHLNMVALHEDDVLSAEERTRPLTANEELGLERGQAFGKRGTAYQRMNSTVPYTVGALLLSPISALAYYGEKMYRWSAPDSQPDLDDVLTECLLLWFTDSLISSLWHYRGLYQADWTDEDRVACLRTPVKVPTGFSFGRHELLWFPQEDLARLFDVRHYTVLDRGGHFLASEQPALLASEIKSFFSTLTES